MKASDLFVLCLEKEGVEYIFGVPGEENLDLLESLRTSKIKFILTRNEQTAVFMAANYGRFTGKVGVAIATLGPGATNMITGIAYAQLGGMPVLVITGQKPIKKSKQGLFQIIDVVSMLKPITKSTMTLVSADRIPTTIKNAIKLAEEERPGVVHIELPEDVAGELSDNTNFIEPIKIRRPVIDEKMLNILIKKLELAKTPIILVGAGSNRKTISKYLTEFITKYNIPFFSSQMGKGVVDERLDQYLGTAALSDKDYIHNAIKLSDLIITIGHDIVEKPTYLINLGEKEVIHINFYPAITDNFYFPNLEVVGDIGNTLWQLSEAKINTNNWNFKEIYKTNSKNKEILQQNLKLDFDSKIMMPRRFVKELRENLKDDDILALDNGLYKVWIARNYKAYYPNTVLLDNALATMGAGISSAITAKLLNPEKNVVCIVGDGGFLMNLGDLETAVRLKIDVIIIIINDNSYGMVKWKQSNSGFGNFGLDLSNPDFVKLALSFGANGYKIEKPDDFEKTLKKSLKNKGITILDLPFKYPKDIV